MTSALALLTVSLLALAGNGIAHAGSTSSPYPSAAAAPSGTGPGVPVGAAESPVVPSARTSTAQDGRASGEGIAADPDENALDDQPTDREPDAADEDPGAQKPADDKPGDEEPGGDGPGDEKPADDGPGGEPGDDGPGGDGPGGDGPGGGPGGDEPGDEPGDGLGDEPGDDGPGGDGPGDGPGGEEPGGAPAGSTSDAATTAAELLGWGTPLPGSDEFDYTGPPNPEKWNVAGECWAGHAGNGKRCASRSTVDGSKLVQTGLADGDSAWVASKIDQRYGRWEARVRSTGDGPANGRQYHPLLIVWPTSNQWPQDGEYDFLENGAPGQDCVEAFIHYPHGPGAVQQEFVKESDCGAPLSEWHNVAFEWTPDHVRGYIDGKKWFDLSGGAQGGRKNIQDMPSGHLTIQLDNFFGGGMQPATYEIDWVRIYGLR